MICAPDGGDPRRPDRLPPRPTDRFLVVANAGNAQVVSRRAGGAPRWVTGGPRRPFAGDGPRRDPGPAVGRHPHAADRCRPRARCATTRSPRARWRGSRLWSPGPATRARTASRSSSRSAGPPSSGTRCSPAARRTACCRSGSAPATRSGSRPACRSTATSSTATTTRSRRASAGSSSSTSPATSSAGPRSRRSPRDGPRRGSSGLTVEGRGIARHGYPVHAGERRTGVVTSGTQSPTLGVPIAMAYVAPADGEPGTMVDVEIRDARVPARVVPLPFYRRPRGASSSSAVARHRRRGGAAMVPGSALHPGPRVGPGRR